MFLLIAPASVQDLRSDRQRLPDFPLIRCPELRLLYFTLPFAVILTRFFRPLWVFIFGIAVILIQTKYHKSPALYDGSEILQYAPPISLGVHRRPTAWTAAQFGSDSESLEPSKRLGWRSEPQKIMYDWTICFVSRWRGPATQGSLRFAGLGFTR